MKINKLTISIFTFFLLITFDGSECFAQEIELEPNRQENTYKTWNVNGVLDIQVRDAKDRGNALSGVHKLKYKCKEDSETEFLRDIELTNGNSARLQNICSKLIAEVVDVGDKKIRLREGAATNGFTVRKEDNSAYLQTNNVIDPNTNKPLEGSQKINVSFYPDYEPSLLFAVHRGGNSRTKRLRRLLSTLETEDGESLEFKIEGAIQILDLRTLENRSDNDSSGRDKTDSTNESPTKNKTNEPTDPDNRSSTTTDDAEVTPVRSGSSVSKQSKSSLDNNSSNEHKYSASNGRETIAVALIKNARKNGYKTWKKDGFFFFQANNVFDPISKELAEGLHDLSYRCGSENGLTRIKLKLSRGNTQRVAIACALINEPKILLLDEPSPN